MAKTLYADVTGCTEVISVRKNSSHDSATAVVVIECVGSTLTLGDAITVDLGYVGDFGEVFVGYVKQIDRRSNSDTYLISAQDEMVRAVDYFIASSKPDNPFAREKIKAEDLVEDLLNLAGITNYGFDATNFTFATKQELEINLISVYDMCSQIADILAWHLYADNNGKIWFVNRKPHIVAGDTASITINDVDTIRASEITSDRDLRNRVVVYGKNGISAESKTSSPYLPAGYYRTIVASTELLDVYSLAKKAANFNLELYNRLNESVNIQVEGNWNLDARDIVHINNTILGINEDFYVYGTEHKWDSGGYVTDLVVRK